MTKNPLVVFFRKLYRHLVRKLIREACGFTLQHYPDDDDLDRPDRRRRDDDDDARRADSAIEIVPPPRRANGQE